MAEQKYKHTADAVMASADRDFVAQQKDVESKQTKAHQHLQQRLAQRKHAASKPTKSVSTKSRGTKGGDIELTDLEAGEGKHAPAMYDNPLNDDPDQALQDAEEDDRALRNKIAQDQESARLRLIKRMRARNQKSTGKHKHPTIQERRASRMQAKSGSIQKTQGMLSSFWNGHRDGRKHKPQGHHGTDQKQKEAHEAAYSRFLKHKFTPDVAYPGEDKPHISSLRARVRQALRSPRLVADLSDDESENQEPSFDSKTGSVKFHGKKYSPISWCNSHTGTHKCHCRCCHLEGTHSDFAGYGLGIVLWFKYVKWMGMIFFGLLLLSIPQLLMFGSSGKLMGQLETESKLHVLAQLGMANMGEGSTLCVSAPSSSVLALQCGKGQLIQSISSVHYGMPSGLCECPGTSKNEEQYFARLPPDATNPMSCTAGDGLYPFSGVETYSQDRCCSSKKTVSGVADFSSLLFTDSSECYSPNYDGTSTSTATSNSSSTTTTDGCASSKTDPTGSSATHSYAFAIVKEGCLGKNGCQLPVNDLTMWNGTAFSLCHPPNSTDSTDFSNASRSVAYNCWRALGTKMVGCKEISNFQKSLNIVAVCTDESMTFFDVAISKNTVWVVLTLTEICQCIFVLFMIFMLRTSEKADVTEQGNEVQSIELFTIFLPRIHDLAHDPVYKDEEASASVAKILQEQNKKNGCCKTYPTHMVDTTKLSRSLRHHFESLLSSCRPVVDHKKLGLTDAEWDTCQLNKKYPVKVADVKFGRRDGEVIRLQKLRGRVLHELQHETAHLEHHHETFSPHQLKKMEDHVHKELDRLESLGEKIAELEANPTIHNPECAFVTFQKREDKLRALALYPRSTIFYCMCQPRDCARCCCSEKRIRAYVPPSAGGLQGEDVRSTNCSCSDTPDRFYRTWIATETPAPENIRWENLTVGKTNRCCRVLCSSIVTIILLLATIGGSILVKNETLKQARLYPNVDCNSLKLTQPGATITKTAAILDEMKLEQMNSTFFEEKNARESLLGCYCSEKNVQDLYTLTFDLDSVPGLTAAGFTIPKEYASSAHPEFARNWCLKWLYDTATEEGLGVASVLLIVIVNMLLKVIMKRLVNGERPISQSKFSTSLTTKLVSLFIVCL